VANCNDLKKLILREFHVKLYSSHPGYQKTMKKVKKLYYWLNLKKSMVDFMARCLDC